jgi:MYXO-CTERM domain-containing protein
MQRLAKLLLPLLPSTILLLTPPAHAQCSGGLEGALGVALASGGRLHEVTPDAVPTLFGAAECLCDSDDLMLQLALTVVPVGASDGEVWVGAGCDDPAARVGCERIATLSREDLRAATGEPFSVRLSARALFSPLRHDCAAAPSAANGVFVVVGDGACALPLVERSAGPPPVARPDAVASDGALTVSWQPSPGAVAYQVLCADGDGRPTRAAPSPPAYSACLSDGILERRALPVTDSRDDLATSFAGTRGSPTVGIAPFDHLDPQFACSPMLDASALSTTIDHLGDGHAYRLTVLAVDAAGNATPSAVVTAAPAPPQLEPARGCSAAGPPSGSAPVALLLVVALAAFAARRRRIW